MCKTFILFMLFIAVMGTVAFFYFRKTNTDDVTPEVVDVRASEATIAWVSEKANTGKVFYMPAGSTAAPSEAMEALGSSRQHIVVIAGLKPSSRYTYWIENSSHRFQFQTQPALADPFSFLMLAGQFDEQIVSLVSSEVPEFIISLSGAEQQTDIFSAVRPYIPIYGPDGVDSPFLAAIGEKRPAGPWTLDWGGLRLIFANGSQTITPMLNAPAAHTLGVIGPSFKIEKEIITQTPLHQALTSHNNRVPDRPVAFVAVLGEDEKHLDVDGIRYFGIVAGGPKAQTGPVAVRVDVDIESMRAVFLDDNREVVLKSTPLKEERTCAECRRLADKGAYEESVKAYQEFIKSHQGHFQISDAYFAIASIYDEKLFNFSEALQWYQRLLDEYPTETRVPLAKQRIAYLQTHSDYDYKPLVQFEQIRKIEFARKKHLPEERDKLLLEVESIIQAYPDSTLAPAMQYWLANQYRQSDTDKAVRTYQQLKEAYPDSPLAQDVLIEIAQTYYDAGRYRETIEVSTKALAELPAQRETLTAQIARSERNIRRDKIAWVCWGVLAVLTGLIILAKPVGMKGQRNRWAAAAFVVLLVVLMFAAWLIREQFTSTGEMLSIAFFFSAAAVAGALLSITFTEKFCANANALTALLGSITGLVFWIVSLYLIVYYANMHYLIVVGM